MIQAVSLNPSDTRPLPFLFGGFPSFLIDDRIVQSIRQKILILLHPAILIPCSLHLFRLIFPVSNLPYINRIIQYLQNRASGKVTDLLIPEPLLCISMLVQIFTDGISSGLRPGKLVKDDPDNLRFLRVHNQRTVFWIQFISKRRLPAIPLSLPSLLFPAFHSLNQDILSFNLRHRWQDCNGQLAGIFGRVNAILHADQIHSVILDILEWVEHIRRIAPKPWEFKDQNIGNAVLLLRHILEHPGKFRPAGDILSRFSGVTVFPDNLHILELGKFRQPVFLCLKAITLYLHGRGHPHINITFLFSHSAASSKYSVDSGIIR